MATKVQIILEGKDNASDDVNAVKRSLGELNNTPLSGITGNITKLGNLIGTGLAVGVGAAAVAFGKFAYDGVNAAADLEQQMSGIAAVLGKTAAEVEPLNALIQDLALNPNLTVNTQQAAAAIEMLARNGLDMGQIMDGAAESVVALANATGSDFAQAADVMTDAMAQFNIQAEDLGLVVDAINGAVNNSKFTMNDFALAIAQAGGVASSSGVEFDDFTTTIAAISPLFASGSDAGTSFKTMLQRLAAPTDEAAALMQQLGINVYDSNGQLLGMSEITQQLNQALYGLSEVTTEVGGRTAEQNALLEDAQKAYRSAQQSLSRYETGLSGATLTEAARAKKIAELNAQMVNAQNIITELSGVQGELITSTKQLTEEERSQALGIIFGTDAMRAAAALASMTGEEFDALSAKVNVNGSAFQSASTRMDNLRGDMDILGGVVESLGIQFGEKLLPTLRPVVQEITALASEYGPAVISTMSELSDALGNFVTNVTTGVDPLTIVNLAIKDFGRVIGMNTAEIRAARESFAAFVETITPLYDLFVQVTDPIAQFLADNIQLSDVMTALGIALAAVVIPAVASLVVTLAPLVATFAGLVAAVALVRTAWETDFLGIQTKAGEVIDYLTESFGTLYELFTAGDYAGMFDFILTELGAISEGIGETLSGLLETMTAWFAEQDWALFGAMVWDAIRTYFETVFAIGGAISVVLTTLFTSIYTWFVEQDWASVATVTTNALSESWTGFSASAGDYFAPAVDNIRTELERMNEEAPGIVESWRQSFVDSANEADWESAAYVITSGIVMGIINLSMEATGIPAIMRFYEASMTQEARNVDWDAVGESLIQPMYDAMETLIVNTNPVLILFWFADLMSAATDGVNWGEIGESILMGIGNGIINSSNYIRSAIDQKLSEAMNWLASWTPWGGGDGFNDQTSGGGVRGESGVGGSTPAPSSKPPMSGDRRVSVNNYVTYNVNARTFDASRERLSTLAQIGGI